MRSDKVLEGPRKNEEHKSVSLWFTQTDPNRPHFHTELVLFCLVNLILNCPEQFHKKPEKLVLGKYPDNSRT